MKLPTYRIDLLFIRGKKTIAMQDISGWTIEAIIAFLQSYKKLFPKINFKIKRRRIS